MTTTYGPPRDPIENAAYVELVKSLATKAVFDLEDQYHGATKDMTPIERAALCVLLSRSYWEAMKVEPQKNIGPYRVDFLVSWEFNRTEKIVIECDGHDFHERTKEQAQKDKERDRTLQAMGYRVYRFTGSEIWRTKGKCVLKALEIEPCGEINA